MKLLRALFGLVLLCGLVRPALAFQMIVVDPNYTDISSLPYGPFSFSACQAGQGVDTSVYMSCFTALNDTGAPLTTISVFVPLTVAAPAGSSIDCNTSYSGSFFTGCVSTAETTAAGSGYLLTYTLGSIPSGFAQGIFTIALDGPIEDFGPSSLAGGSTPEPESLTLLGTGLLSVGGLVFRRRRK